MPNEDGGFYLPIANALKRRWQIKAAAAERLAAWVMGAFLITFLFACCMVFVCGIVVVFRFMSALLDSVPASPFITIR